MIGHFGQFKSFKNMFAFLQLFSSVNFQSKFFVQLDMVNKAPNIILILIITIKYNQTLSNLYFHAYARNK